MKIKSLAKLFLHVSEVLPQGVLPAKQISTMRKRKSHLLRSRNPGNLFILTPSLILVKSIASMAFSTRGMLSQMKPAIITSVVHSDRRIPWENYGISRQFGGFQSRFSLSFYNNTFIIFSAACSFSFPRAGQLSNNGEFPPKEVAAHNPQL